MSNSQETMTSLCSRMTENINENNYEAFRQNLSQTQQLIFNAYNREDNSSSQPRESSFSQENNQIQNIYSSSR